MPYFTRLKEVDRVGFEPTTSAAFIGCSLLPSRHFLSSIIASKLNPNDGVLSYPLLENH
jgi:hypothetical protein